MKLKKECSNVEPINRNRSILEIILCFSLMLFLTILINVFGSEGGLWIGVLSYWFPCAVIVLYILKAEKKPLSSFGLKRMKPRNILEGLGLGILMFIVQQIPLLIIGMDYSLLSMAPNAPYILMTTLYCFFCVGFAEELIFRGFLLQKTLDVCHIKWICVVINMILFYAIHWSSLPHGFGGFYSIAANVLILCIYYLSRKEKSLVPLMIGHGFYDTLVSVILPVFVYYFFH